MPMRLFFAVLVLLFSALPVAVHADEDAEERRLIALALDHGLEQQLRVQAVADRLRVANAELCGKEVAPVLGLFAADHRSFRERYRQLDFVKPFVKGAVAHFELGDDPRVLLVVPGSAAEEAGVRAGDVILAVGGEDPRLRGDLELSEDQWSEGAIPLSVRRGDETLELAVPVRMGCEFAAYFEFGTQINAFATHFGDLTGIYFYDGLLQRFPTDDELAIIMGHEFAHLVRRHTTMGRTIKRFEAEADLLGLYFAARAGFDITIAKAVWQSMALANPRSARQQGFYAHPLSAERSLALDREVGVIEGKRASGAVLAPAEESFALVLPEVDEETTEEHRVRLRDDALDALREHQSRIIAIAQRLLVAGLDECSEREGATFGAVVERPTYYGVEKDEEMAPPFGDAEDVSVFALAPGGPADTGGLQVGDRVRRVGGKKIRKPQQVAEQFRRAEGATTVEITRGEAEMELVIPEALGCSVGVLVDPSANAAPDRHKNGKDMVIPVGLARFARNDDELAIALAHQLAHHAIGTFRSIDAEVEADAIGLRIAAAAGFDVSQAPAFWDRWATQQFWTVSTDMHGSVIPHGALARRAPEIRRVTSELGVASASQ